MAPGRRLPFAPLQRVLERRVRPPSHQSAVQAKRHGRIITDATIGQALGVARTHVCRARHTGLTLNDADRFAHALNMHPLEIWPEYHQ